LTSLSWGFKLLYLSTIDVFLNFWNNHLQRQASSQLLMTAQLLLTILMLQNFVVNAHVKAKKVQKPRSVQIYEYINHMNLRLPIHLFHRDGKNLRKTKINKNEWKWKMKNKWSFGIYPYSLVLLFRINCSSVSCFKLEVKRKTASFKIFLHY
jgi:hypothetical protein